VLLQPLGHHSTRGGVSHEELSARLDERLALVPKRRRCVQLAHVAGVALEWFMRLLRVEAGVGLRDGGVGVTVDINRDWWGLL